MSTVNSIFLSAIPAIISFFASLLVFYISLTKLKRSMMPEIAANHLLSHKGYTDRSFKAISSALGGWDNNPDELRKILVGAGAIRIFKDNGKGEREEFWYLLDRENERISRLKNDLV